MKKNHQLHIVLLLAIVSTFIAARFGFTQAERQSAMQQQLGAIAHSALVSAPAPIISLTPALQLQHCAVTLRFHGAKETQQRAQYWLQFIQQDLQLLEVSKPLICGEFTPRFITADACKEDNGRAWCPLSPDLSGTDLQDTAIIHIVITPSGLANTRNGVVFLHEQASALVLRHELGHALGFADEYRMHPELATQFCSGQFNFRPLNMVITENNWVTDSEYQKLISELPWRRFHEQALGVREPSGIWRLGSQNNDKVGLFAAETCAGTGYYAWKPLAQKTFMQHHEIGVVPKLYWQLIQQRLDENRVENLPADANVN